MANASGTTFDHKLTLADEVLLNWFMDGSHHAA
jgi:hypothetical protein